MSPFHFYYSPRIAEKSLSVNEFHKKREWDRNRSFVRIRFRRPTSAQLSRAVKADEISVVEPTQPLRLARQSNIKKRLGLLSQPFSIYFILLRALLWWFVFGVFCWRDKRGFHKLPQIRSKSTNTHTHQSDAQSFQEPYLWSPRSKFP